VKESRDVHGNSNILHEPKSKEFLNLNLKGEMKEGKNTKK
jgi:hypothetical protein